MSELATFLENLGTIISSAIGWMGQILDFILAEPVIFVPMLVFFILGGCAAVLLRIMRG